MNVQEAASRYLTQIIQTCPGIKAILCDDYTFSILSVLSGKSELYAEEVVIIDNLLNYVRMGPNDSISNMGCIICMRPSDENIELLKQELEKPHFRQYSLVFTSRIPDPWISEIASSDQHARVHSVKEMYLSYMPLNGRLFSLAMNDMTNVRRGMGINNIVNGLVGLLYSLRIKPEIRYEGRSQACKSVAMAVQERVYKTDSAFYGARSDATRATVLILDRRGDPVTPLVYGGALLPMVHNVLGINNNIVKLENDECPFEERAFKAMAEISVMFFADAGERISEMFRNIGAVTGKSKTALDTRDSKLMLEVMLAARETNYVHNMFNVYDSLNKALRSTSVKCDVIQLTQLISSMEDMRAQEDMIRGLIENPQVTNEEALRLVLLFALRYEKRGSDGVTRLLDLLRSRAWRGNELQYIDTLYRIAGSDKRTVDIFGNKTFGAKVFSALKAFTEDKDAYNIYDPPLKNILSSLQSGDLSREKYPYAEEKPSEGKKSNAKKVIVFYIGGVTYDEHVVASRLSTSGYDVIVGGTTVHNGETFLEWEVAPYV